MTDPKREELQMQMADALTGRLSPSERQAFEAALAADAELRAEFARLESAASLLEQAYPQAPALNQTWLRIEKSLGWREAGQGGSSRLEAEAFARKAAAAESEQALESKQVTLGHDETVDAPSPRAHDELAAARASTEAAPHRSPFWYLAPVAALLVLGLLIAQLFVRHEPETGRVAATASEAPGRRAIPAPDAANVRYVRGSRTDLDDQRGLALVRRMGPVAVFDAERKAWRGVAQGERVPYGARLRSGPQARAELAFGSSRIFVDARTELLVAREANGRGLELSSGRALVELAPDAGALTVHAGTGSMNFSAAAVEIEVPAPDLAFARVLGGRAQIESRLGAESETMALDAPAGVEVLVSSPADAALLDSLSTPVKARARALMAQPARAQNLAAEGQGAWIQALEAPPAPAAASVGQLVVLDEEGKPAEPLRVERLDITAHLRGPLALTRIDHVFRNETDRTLEGTFYFPLPPGAAISRFAMFVDDKTLIEGEVVERQKARAVYESILRAKRDPALLEWMEGNVFRARIFPILPNSTKRVILEYTQLLPAHYETRRYILPLVSELTRKHPIGRLEVDVIAETSDGQPLREVSSPSYYAQTRVEGLGTPRAHARLRLDNVKPEADFVLNVAAPREQPIEAVLYAEEGEAPYVLLGIQPQPALAQAAGRASGRDVLIVAETSGARSAEDRAAQTKALDALLSGLNASDRVLLAGADVALTPLTAGGVPPFSAALDRARADLAKTTPLGALDLGNAVVQGAALLSRHARPDRARLLIFVGAGIPALGTLDAGQLAADGAAALKVAATRFVGIAVGRQVETLALAELAARSGGFCVPLRPDENLEEAAFTLSLSLQQPILEAAAWRDETGLLTGAIPARLPALLPGHEYFVHARLKETRPFAVALEARIDGMPYAVRRAVTLGEGLDRNPAVGRAWARARMDDLLAQAPDSQRREEILALAQTWTLMSPYTSFLVLESNDDYARYEIDRGQRRKLWRDPTVLAQARHEEVDRIGSQDKGKDGLPAQDQALQGRLETGNAARAAQPPANAWKPQALDGEKLREARRNLESLKQAAQAKSALAADAKELRQEQTLQRDGKNRAESLKEAKGGGPGGVPAAPGERETGERETAEQAAAMPTTTGRPAPAPGAPTAQADRGLRGQDKPKKAEAAQEPKAAPAAAQPLVGQAVKPMATHAPEESLEKNATDEAPAGQASGNKRALDAAPAPPPTPPPAAAPPAPGAMAGQGGGGGRPVAGSEGGADRRLTEQAKGRPHPETPANQRRGAERKSAQMQSLLDREDDQDAEKVLREDTVAEALGEQEMSDLEGKENDATDASAIDRGFLGFALDLAGKNEDDEVLGHEESEVDELRKSIGTEAAVERQYARAGELRYRETNLKKLKDSAGEAIPEDGRSIEALARVVQTSRPEPQMERLRGMQQAKQAEAQAEKFGKSADANMERAKSDAAAAPEALWRGSLGAFKETKPVAETRRHEAKKAADEPPVQVQNFLRRIRDEAAGREEPYPLAQLTADLETLGRAVQAQPNDLAPRLQRAAATLLVFVYEPARVAGAPRELLCDLLAEDLQRAFAAPDAGGADGEAIREVLSWLPGFSREERLALLERQPAPKRRCGDWLRIAGLQADTPAGRAAAGAFLDRALAAWKSQFPNQPLPLPQARALAALALKLGDLPKAQNAFDEALVGPAAGDAKLLAEVAALEAQWGFTETARAHTLRALGALEARADHAAARAILFQNLALLSDGIDGYKVLADGLAEFRYTGPAAERLARAAARRIADETDPQLLDAAVPLFGDEALRARILARRAELEPNAERRAGLYAEAMRLSGDETYLQALAESLRAAGQCEALIDLLQTKLRAGSGEPWQWTALAQAHTAAGDRAAAYRALTQAVALRPREAAPRLALAEQLEAMGRHTDALREYRAACELEPQHAAAHRQLAAAARRHRDHAAEGWALVRMLGGSWLSEDGGVWGEAERGLEDLLKRMRAAGQADAADKLERERDAARVQDLVAVLTWDTDETDIDLHVTEPGKHEVSYREKTSWRGGMLDHDDTDGRGPETYVLKRAGPGAYRIWVKYYRGEPVTKAHVEIFRQRHGAQETRQTYTLELKKAEDEATVLEFTVLP
ncbi:MAG: hypothetical protein HS116_18920 [Planctomycetes bacterium]|nr:hypothetical protein [Planctomycetota bacterium]